MSSTVFRLFIFTCLQCLVHISMGNESVEFLIDQSITNLQKIKVKYQSLAIIKKLYGDCAPCRPIKENKYCDYTFLAPMQDCLEFRQAGYRKSGIYRLSGPGFNRPNVLCDQTSQGWGWTILLRRQDGTVDFIQGWKSYKHGFGRLTGEFWLGNEIVHDLTKSSVATNGSELLINMRIQGQTRNVFAKYGTFSDGDEASKYTLQIADVSGNAPHLTGPRSFMGYHNGMKFSTYDNDNDAGSSHCAQSKGGWWFGHCYITFLTEKFTNGLIWFSDGKLVKMQFVEMKFRRKL